MKKSSINTVATDLYDYASTLDPEDPKYRTTLENIKLLEEARTIRSRRFLTPDAAIGAAASLAGVLAILKFEQSYPLVTKALSFVTKIRL